MQITVYGKKYISIIFFYSVQKIVSPNNYPVLMMIIKVTIVVLLLSGSFLKLIIWNLWVLNNFKIWDYSNPNNSVSVINKNNSCTLILVTDSLFQ